MATATHTTSTVVGLFESRAAAEQAVKALTAGESIPSAHISMISGDTRAAAEIPNIAPIESPGTFDAGTGAAVGGMAGFIGGILALAIPGIGPILAAGPLSAAIMAAGVGAAAGGLIGGLKEHGIPENDAALLSEAIRRGRVMVAAHVPSEKASHIADVLDDNGAVDTEELEGGAPPSGTVTNFKPLTPEAVEAARLKPGEGLIAKERERERRAQVFPGITGGGTTPNA